MGERRPYWNMEMETKQNTPEMREIQWGKLKKKIQDLYDTAPFWKQRFHKAGVKPEQIPALVRDSRGSSMSANPCEVSDEQLTQLLEEIL